jgi:hypothetical protein
VHWCLICALLLLGHQYRSLRFNKQINVKYINKSFEWQVTVCVIMAYFTKLLTFISKNHFNNFRRQRINDNNFYELKSTLDQAFIFEKKMKCCEHSPWIVNVKLFFQKLNLTWFLGLKRINPICYSYNSYCR